jgi:hypothetical protein
MLRFIAWRLLFEVCNVRRWFGHGSGRVQYFAFGANLCPSIMRERRIRPHEAKYFTLENHALRFDHPSPWHGCGYASAAPSEGEAVHGVLYLISERDAARMDFYELVPVVGRYRRTWVEQGGERLYFYQTNRATPRLKPTAKYLAYIVDGLAPHPGVDPSRLARLAALETVQPGAYVASYLGERAAFSPRWLYVLYLAYRRLEIRAFIALVYRASATEHLIRRRDPPAPR